MKSKETNRTEKKDENIKTNTRFNKCREKVI